MLYHELKVGEKTYKLRLNTRDVVSLEKNIGMNPLSIFGDGKTIPPLSTMVAVLQASLQKFHHGISLNDVYEIFDEYIADGNSMTDFLTVIIEIYKVSGLITIDNETEESEKN